LCHDKKTDACKSGIGFWEYSTYLVIQR